MAREHRKDRGFFAYTLADGSVRYAVRVYRQYRPYKWSGFKTKQDARNWYDDRRKDIREGRPFPGRHGTQDTVRDLIDHHLAQVKNKKSYSLDLTYAAFWKAQIGECEQADNLVDSIDKARTLLLTKGHARGPLTHATVNRYVAWLHHVFQGEVNKGTIARNPCRGLKFKEPKAPEVEFTEAEELAIAAALGDDADIPSLAILTGLRQDEQFGLRWDTLDLEQGYGKLHDPKGGEPQIFLINREAAEIFRRLKARAGSSPWVFPDKRNPCKHINGKSWYNNVFKKACDQIGITLSRKDGKTYHTLRHTFASRLQKAGVEVKDLKDLGRWKSWKAMDRYLKRDVSRLRTGIERLHAPVGTAQNQPIVELSEGDKMA